MLYTVHLYRHLGILFELGRDPNVRYEVFYVESDGGYGPVQFPSGLPLGDQLEYTAYVSYWCKISLAYITTLQNQPELLFSFYAITSK